jgi:hypothetical protein
MHAYPPFFKAVSEKRGTMRWLSFDLMKTWIDIDTDII